METHPARDDFSALNRASKLIGEALDQAGIPVCHLDEYGNLLTQQQVIDRLTHGQLDLFGQSSLHEAYPGRDV